MFVVNVDLRGYKFVWALWTLFQIHNILRKHLEKLTLNITIADAREKQLVVGLDELLDGTLEGDAIVDALSKRVNSVNIEYIPT